MNLVGLQQSAKRIRNPFGFDFTHTWDKQPITLKGDGQWYDVVGPLQKHLAKHLYQKVRYQYHDEQVASLKAKGDKDAARKFRVSKQVENKIWRMITGEDLHKGFGAEDNKQDAADLTQLKKEVSRMHQKAVENSSGVNISKILNEANAEAEALAENVGEGESGHTKGTATKGKAKKNRKIKEAIDVSELSPQEPEAPKKAKQVDEAPPEDSGEDEFAELDELDELDAEG